MTTAIIPIKAFAAAKGRLSVCLPDAARRALVAWMLDHVLRACMEAPSVTEVVVVAGDDHGAAVARRRGAGVLREPRPGLQSALAAADRHLAGADATLVVAADLPHCAAEDLEAVVVLGLAGPGVVVAPTADGGTAALLRRPPGVIPPAFGPRSAAAHAELARAAGTAFALCHRANLAHDIDTPAQLRAAAARCRDVASALNIPAAAP